MYTASADCQDLGNLQTQIIQQTHKGFKDKVVNRTFPSLIRGSLRIMLTVPLNRKVV